MTSAFRNRIRAGDPTAFAELFDGNARAIHRHALRLTGDRAAAEDVVSLTFLEAWRLRAGVRHDDASLTPWLFGIATNVLRNTRRSARRHRAALQRLPAPEPSPDFADELVDRAGAADELAAARAALARLRPAEREVIAMCVWSGLDYAAAAEALGVPIGTVRSRLSRARARLQALAESELRGGRRGGGSARPPGDSWAIGSGRPPSPGGATAAASGHPPSTDRASAAASLRDHARPPATCSPSTPTSTQRTGADR